MTDEKRKMNDNQKEIENNRKTTVKLLQIVGVFFMIIGFYCVFTEDNWVSLTLFDGDKDTSLFFGIGLIFVGCIDLFVMPRILQGSTKNT